MPIPPRVSVIALRTADLARSTAFYGALGWELSPASTAAMSLFKAGPTRDFRQRPARCGGRLRALNP
jgi:catechol 2,3-dioxygenase-like lactoylglutathione lyase family enzyme